MDSMSLATEVTAVVFAVLAGVSTVARCYVRFFVLSKGQSWDDLLLLLALAFFFGLVALAVAMTDWQVGLPSSYNDPNAAVELLKLIFFFESAYGLCVLALKLAIAIALLRIMVKATHLLQRRVVQAVLFFNVVMNIVYFFVVIFQCSPVDYFWRDDIPGTCLTPQVVNNIMVGTGSLNTLCDFVFTFLPMYVVWKLRMPSRLKLAVCGILGLGMIASIATIVRFYYISLSTNDSGQEAAFVVGYVIWSNVEIGLGIIACNLATLRPLFRFLGDKPGWTTESQPGHSPGLSGGQRQWQMIPAATEKHRNGSHSNGSNSYSLEMLRPTGPPHDDQALTPPTYRLRDDESDNSIDPHKDLESNDRAAWKSSEVRVHQSTL